MTSYHHTSVTVADVLRGVGFWRDVMGFEVIELGLREGAWLGAVVGVPGARCRIAHLRGHGLHLEFIQYLEPAGGEDVTGPPDRPGTAHIAFLVEDIAQQAGRMLAAGAAWQGEITRCTSGPSTGCLAAYLRDPNGILVELIQPAPRDRLRLAHWCTLGRACAGPASGVACAHPSARRDGQARSPPRGPRETRRAPGAGRSRRATG